MTLLFHLAMAAVDAAALLFLARRPGFLRLLVGLIGAVVAGWVLATVLGRQVAGSVFAFLKYLTHGVALHGPLLLGASAWILRRRRPLALATAAVALAVAAAAVQGFLIEPRWLEVSRHTIESPKLEEPIRVVVLADYQTDRLGAYERRVWDTAQAQAADLVLLPGDYLQVYDRDARRRLLGETNAYLRQIDFGSGARMGTFAVAGDVESRDPDWADLFAGLQVMTFRETRTIELRGFSLTALSPEDSRSRTLRVPSSERFHIVFGHAPDYALLDVDADLQIAGHTHGGQLRVPGLGPLMTFSRVPRAWAAGVTDLGNGRTLVVSRGLGLERGSAPRLRFLCRPEIVVLDLVPESD